MLKYKKESFFSTWKLKLQQKQFLQLQGESRKIQLKRKYSLSGNNGSVFTECFQLSVVSQSAARWAGEKMTENSNHKLISYFILITFH